MDTASLGLPELSIVLLWVIAATVFLIQKLKYLLCVHVKGRWTQKIPGWLWLVASVVIPFGLVMLVAQEWAQNLINPMLPEALRLNVTPDAAVATALTATIGANGSYAVAKKWGLAGDYSPGGPNDVTPPLVPEPGEPAPVTTSLPETAPEVPPGPATLPSAPIPAAPTDTPPEATDAFLGPLSAPTPVALGSSPTVRLLMEIDLGDGPGRWVMLEDDQGAHLYPLTGEPRRL